MESQLKSLLKSALDKLVCYHAYTVNPQDLNIPSLVQETISELQQESFPTLLTGEDEDIEIQQVPPTKTKKVPLIEKDFKITNLDTGREIDIRDETNSQFVNDLSALMDTSHYSETLSVYFSQKQKMNKALWDAIEHNQAEICRLLLSRKNYGDLVAQTNARGLNEETSMHMSARMGLLRICEILLERGENTDVNAKDADGCTPLHLACKNGHYLTAQFLIRSGAQINCLDRKENTPMHYAAIGGEVKLIRYLFTKFSSLNQVNLEGVSPMDILKSKGIDLSDNQDLENISISQSIANSDDSVIVEFEAQQQLALNFQDFQAVQILGRGSFGEVFLVERKTTGEKFAMKVLRKDRIVGQNLTKYAMVERNVLSYIKHPFIVGLNFAFQSPQKLYLVLDYCPGGNLTGYIIRQRFFNETTAKFYMCELILALEELHSHGIIYRDLKPDNVVIDAEGHSLLTDFGLSKEGISDNFSAKSFCGSIAYLAPEMIKRKGHGKAVDWYLLGVLFYEMLVGTPPFYSNSKEQLFFNIENTKAIIPARVSSSASSLLRKLLKKNPEKRIGSVNGAREIKNHAFFQDVDWEKVMRKEVKPPIKPIVMMIPGYIPKTHTIEDLTEEPDTRHLEGWTFVANE